MGSDDQIKIKDNLESAMGTPEYVRDEDDKMLIKNEMSMVNTPSMERSHHGYNQHNSRLKRL